MKKTYLDSSVLVRAARGDDALSRPAIDILCDPEREFVSSVLVRMELLPLAAGPAEIDFYEQYFERVMVWSEADNQVMESALEEAQVTGVSPIDAMHLVLAASAGCQEFITAESGNTPVFSCKRLAIKGL